MPPTDARIAIIRPDFGALGGFERHLSSIVSALEERGWKVEELTLEARRPRARLLGLPIKPVQHEFHDDFFKYASLVAQTIALDLDRFDAVLTTQPPTYLARHPRKVALFYHQARQFYDLADVYVESGFAAKHVHETAMSAVHHMDRAGVKDVRHWLAGSMTSADRLRRFWSIPDDRISLYEAPPACAVDDRPPPYEPGGPILHVGRMEWPKRATLAVQAIHLLDGHRLDGGTQAVFVGGGSRADFVRSLDAELGQGVRVFSEQMTWRNRGIYTEGWQPSHAADSGRIDFVGSVDDQRRDGFYRAASVVLAPAHNEDYGLTALEAMSFARPVIVCDDGGGLTELVEDGVNGLVVEPRADAIAKAISRLVDDPGYAAALGLAGFKKVTAITEDRAVSQLERVLERVL